MKIFITSDLHFCHQKEFLYAPRGFSSVEDMNIAIVENWNRIVDEEDHVYILGDLMLNDNDRGMKLFNQLKGKKHIILGNHDTDARQALYRDGRDVSEIVYATIIKYKKYHFYLSHYPTLTSNFDIDKSLKECFINLCGHTHTSNKFEDLNKGLIYHVELDAHECKPVLLDEIIEDLKNVLFKKVSEYSF